MTMIPGIEILLRLFLAAILGGLIGIERERTSWFAGLRTHMLVCMGSALIMIVSQYGFNDVLDPHLVVLDPSRIAAQVVSGIGFLGAGTILFWKNMIRGLTTAASLWAVAAIGLAIGGGLYLAAVGTTLMIFIVLAGVKPLEKLFFKKEYLREIKFTIFPGVPLNLLEEVITKLGMRTTITGLQIEMEDNKEIVHLFFKTNSEMNTLTLVSELKALPGVEKIEVIE